MTLVAEEVVKAIESRYSEAVIVDRRWGQQDLMSTAFERWEEVRKLLRGEISFRNSDGSMNTAHMTVQNLANSAIKYQARSVAESVPTITVDAPVGSPKASAARLQEAIHNTHWSQDDAELKVEKWVMDFARCGVAYMACYYDPDEDQPCHKRLRPTGCLPTWDEEKLLDLIYVQSVKLRAAKLKYPALGGLKLDETTDMEIIDFHDRNETWKIASQLGSGGTRLKNGAVIVLKQDTHNLGIVPVAWRMEPTYDDFFEGDYDQMNAQIVALHQMYTLIIDNALHQAYPERLEEGEVDSSESGPEGRTVLGSNAKVSYLQAPAVNQAIFPLMQLLEEHARGTATFNRAAQGDVRQSIASAAFVAATQGESSGQVRHRQRSLAHMRKLQSIIDSKLDRMYWAGETKDLAFPVESKLTYVPDRDLPENPRLRVSYTNAGLDPLNGDVRRIQLTSAKLMSRETGILMDPNIIDKNGEMQRIYKDQAVDVGFQRALSDPSFDYKGFMRLMEEDGLTVEKAFTQLSKDEAIRAAQVALLGQGQGAPGPQPALPAGGEDLQSALQTQKGAVPGQTPPAGATPPTPPPSFAPAPFPSSAVQTRTNT